MTRKEFDKIAHIVYKQENDNSSGLFLSDDNLRIIHNAIETKKNLGQYAYWVLDLVNKIEAYQSRESGKGKLWSCF